MSSVILVGNDGHSAKHHELGKVIDSYDVVVRFNWYETEGKEKYIGSKTDIWVTSFYDPLRSKKASENKTQVILHSWVWNPRYCKLQQSFSEGMKRSGWSFKIARGVEKLIYDMMAYGRIREGGIKSVQKPSLNDYVFSSYGIMAWWLAMEKENQYCSQITRQTGLDLPKCDKIDVYGFDWWDWGKESWVLDDAIESQKKYNPRIELSLFTYLFEDKKMKDLNPDSSFHKYYE